VELYLH